MNNFRSSSQRGGLGSNQQQSTEGFCQKCFTGGHWTYQCKGDKSALKSSTSGAGTYKKRLSHTEKLEMMRKGIPIIEDFDDFEKKPEDDDDAIWTCSDSDSYLNPKNLRMKYSEANSPLYLS